MNASSSFEPDFGPPRAAAPCGIGCRYASPLAGWPDYVWCRRVQAPRATNRDRVDCPWFDSGPGSAAPTAPPFRSGNS